MEICKEMGWIFRQILKLEPNNLSCCNKLVVFCLTYIRMFSFSISLPQIRIHPILSLAHTPLLVVLVAFIILPFCQRYHEPH